MKTLLLAATILLSGCATKSDNVPAGVPTRIVYPSDPPEHVETVEEARRAISNFQWDQRMLQANIDRRQEIAQQDLQRQQDFNSYQRDYFSNRPRYFSGQTQSPNGRWMPFDGFSY